MLLGVSMVSGGGGCYYVARSQYGIRGGGGVTMLLGVSMVSAI